MCHLHNTQFETWHSNICEFKFTHWKKIPLHCQVKMRTMVPVSLWSCWGPKTQYHQFESGQGHHVDPHGHLHMGLENLWGYVFLKGAWHPKWIETTILVRYCATCAFWVNIHQHCQQLYPKNNSLSAKSAETDLLAIAKLPAENWKKKIE